MHLRMPKELRERCKSIRTLGGRDRSLSDVCRCAWRKARKLDRADRRVVLSNFAQTTTRADSLPYQVDVPAELEAWARQYSHAELCAFVAWAINGIPEVPAVPRELQVTHE